MSRKSEISQERAKKRAIQNNRKQKQAMSSYLAEDQNFTGFSNQLGALGLKLRDIPGDGNCLFRALGDQLDGHSDNHCEHREQTVNYMIAYRCDFEPFVEDDVPFATHVDNLRNPGTYAGNDAIVAFARNNNVNVVIHQVNAPIWTIKGCDRPNTRQLHIAYHNGDHYSSIRKITDNSKRPANIKLSECKVSENVIPKGRSVKKRSDGITEYDMKKIGNISRVTGCKDLQYIKQILKEVGYDEDEAVGVILSSWEPDVDDSSNLSSHNQNKATPIWSQNGTGTSTRLFGNSVSESNNSSNRTRKPPAKKLTNRKRQEQARRDRKKKNEARKRNNNTPSDSDESEILVKNLSVLNV